MPTSSELAAALNAARELVQVLSGLRAVGDAFSSPPTSEQTELFHTVYGLLGPAVADLRNALRPVSSAFMPIWKTNGGPVPGCGTWGVDAHDLILTLGRELAAKLLLMMLWTGGNLSADNYADVQRALAHLNRSELQVLEAQAERECLLTAGQLPPPPGP